MRSVTGRTAGIVLGVVALQALLFTLFTWPALHAAPRDLPVVVAGPAQATAPVAAQLRQAQPGAFDITTTTDPAAADRALRHRDAFAAFLVGPTGMAVHVSSAASPTVAQAITQLAQQQAAQQAQQGQTGQRGQAATRVTVTDVVPADRHDPHGILLALGVLPLVVTSLAAGALLALAVRSRWARLTGAVAYAALAGAVSVALAKYWLHGLPGNYLVDAGVVGLLALAVSAAVGGLGGLLKAPGVGLGALLAFALGLPLSGITAGGAELLPHPWGTVGQWLPPGAASTLLRSVAYFDGAHAAGPVWTLAAWAGVGLVLLAVAPGGRRAGGRKSSEESEKSGEMFDPRALPRSGETLSSTEARVD
jgi:hypothetical protein